jgi:acid stress chaperone HdeB
MSQFQEPRMKASHAIRRVLKASGAPPRVSILTGSRAVRKLSPAVVLLAVSAAVGLGLMLKAKAAPSGPTVSISPFQLHLRADIDCLQVTHVVDYAVVFAQSPRQTRAARYEPRLPNRSHHMKIRLAAIVAAAMIFASPVSAETVDLSTTKCKEFLASSKEDIGLTLAWLDAYYKQEDDPPIIDTDKFVANAKKLAEYCAGNPSVGLITATDHLFKKN